MATTPLISVIVTCYNQERFLAETLQSVANQTYTRWECIVVNDGSSDGTRKIADSWQQKDSRFVCIHKPNGGVSSARNVALKQAKGEFIQFLDGDDTLSPEKLEQVLLLPDARLLVTNFALFREHPDNLRPPFCVLSQEMMNYNHVLTQWDLDFNIPIHTGMFGATILSGFTFNEELKAKEDWLLWLHAFKVCSDVVFIDKPLALYRMHPANMTKNAQHMNRYTIKAYDFLYRQLDACDKQLLYTKVLNLYAGETAYFSSKTEADYEDYMKILRGKKALGVFGALMFRLLRKTGHVLLKKGNTGQ